MKLLIQNAYIVTADEKNTVIPDGSLLAEDGVIVRVGEHFEAEADKMLDAGGMTLMPGLINAHTHIGMTLMRGAADDVELHHWLNDHIFPIEDRLDTEVVYASSLLGMCEMIAGGVTTFADMYFFSEGTIRAAQEIGMRADIGRCIVGDGEEGQKRIDETVELFRRYQSDRIHVRLAPHAIYSCPAETLKKCVSVSGKLGTGLHIHLDETKKEHEDCLREHGVTPTAYLHSLGCLSRQTLLAHGVWLTEEDADVIAETGAAAAHCPTSNLKLASGIAPVRMLREKGVTVALGSDGVASNNRQSLFRDMTLAALLQKGVCLDATALNARETIRMATADGARALGRDDIGVLAPGRKADMILVDQSGIHQQPINDRISNLVYATENTDVAVTIIDGRIVFEKGEYRTVDAERVLAQAETARDRIIGGA